MNLIILDQKVFSWFNSIIGLNSILDGIIKVVAVYTVYLVPVLLIIFFFFSRNAVAADRLEKLQKFLINLSITVLISWQVIARFLGMMFNRERPFDFVGAKELVFHLPSYSFPSDHALFFAFITTYLFLSGYKKWGWLVLIATILVSLSRITAGLHWPGDILGGWIIGVILAFLFYLIRKPIEKYIINPIYNLLKKLKIV